MSVSFDGTQPLELMPFREAASSSDFSMAPNICQGQAKQIAAGGREKRLGLCSSPLASGVTHDFRRVHSVLLLRRRDCVQPFRYVMSQEIDEPMLVWLPLTPTSLPDHAA
jgi:hypothetical protein